MKIPNRPHEWDVSYDEARAIQERLAPRVRLEPLREGEIDLVAGADMALSKPHDLFFASVVVMSYPEMEIMEKRTVRCEASFPYIPGLLSFREAPAVLGAMERLEQRPDAVIFDGQGIAHPRRLGLAAHLGLWLDLPSVGCAKSRLVGEHDEPGAEKGAWTVLEDEGERIGTVLRTRTDVSPVFVSPGHLCDHRSAWELVLNCAVRYRLPEPTRQAHLCVGRAKREFLEDHRGDSSH